MDFRFNMLSHWGKKKRPSLLSYLAGFRHGQAQEGALALVPARLALCKLLERLQSGGGAEAARV
jgi:hypothetical protein